MRNCTRVVVVSWLAAMGLAGGAAAQAPGEAVVTPVRGAWTPRVIATSRPVTEAEPPKAAAVQPVRAQPADLPPPVRTAPAAEAVPRRPAPAGACLVVEKVAPAVTPGKPLVYDIVLRNVGAAAAQRVRLQEQTYLGSRIVATEPRGDQRGGLVTWELATLAAGGEARFRVTLELPPEGEASTTATVSCETECELRVRVPKAGLSLTGAAPPPAQLGLSLTMAAPPPAQVGQKVNFRIQIVNNTASPLTGLVLRARLGAGLQHPQGNQIEATLPALAPGETKPVPLELVAAAAGRLTVAVTVAPPGGPEAAADSAVEVSAAAGAAPAPAPVPPAVTGGPDIRPNPTPAAPTPAPTPAPPAPEPERKPAPAPPPALPDLQPQAQAAPPPRGKPIASAGGPAVRLDLADAEAALEVGRETTYEIRVLNQGAAPTRDVLVRAVVPDEMTLVTADGPGGQPGQVQGKEVAFGPLPSLDGQGQAVYRVRVKALKPGDGRFTARLQTGTMTRPLSQEVSTRVYSDETPGEGETEK